MAAITATDAHAAHEDHGDGLYWKVFGALFVLTALEVSTEWWPEDMSAITATALIIMMVIKFIIVALFFMHLKGDAKILSYVFFFGAVLAVSLFLAMFGAMTFFKDNGLGGDYTFNDPPNERPMPPPPTDPPPIIRETGGGH